MTTSGNWTGRLPFVIITSALLVLFFGLVEVFRLRFARGDVYPEYSSLRSDPLGTQVLAAGLQTAGVDVSRHLRRLDRGTLPEGTWYLAALSSEDFASTTDREWRALLDVIEQGSRVVLAFTPDDDNSFAAAIRKARREQRAREREGGSDDEDAGDEPIARDLLEPEPGTPLPARLGLRVEESKITAPFPLLAQRDAGAESILPAELAWHSTIRLSFEDPAWQMLYTVADQPVALVRAWGRGSIVVSGDSYPLSNEAMLRNRATAWLTWLQGSHRRAVFDESHLGVAEQHGVMSLARRYGLTHTLLVLLGIGLLFVWRNNASLIPAAPPDAGEVRAAEAAEAVGHESATGFVNLLSRTIGARSLFETSLAEFRRSVAWRRLTPESQQALDALAARQPAKPNPVAATREAYALLARSRH